MMQLQESLHPYFPLPSAEELSKSKQFPKERTQVVISQLTIPTKLHVCMSLHPLDRILLALVILFMENPSFWKNL